MFASRVINILLIEDEDFDARRIKNTLKPFENKIKIKDVTSDGHSALKLIKSDPDSYDVIIMDFQIAGSITGENLIKRIKKINSVLQIIVVTKMTINVTDFDFANRLIEAGAMWYCTKYPGDIEEYIYQPTDFILSIFNAFEKRCMTKKQLKSEAKLNNNVEEILQNKKIIANSAIMKKLNEQIGQCSVSNTTVLISGASGTGKELVASNIHYQSNRKFEKFVTINCGSIPLDLIESELFGYEKGAFTGAGDKKPGLFEIANKGTIFLDEIGELPLSSQVKLLRVIQEGEIDKIGRTEKVKVDVRIIAATNKNLREEVTERRFREDLFYRINVVSLCLPSLKERVEDIPVLINHFLEKFSLEMGHETPVISPEAMNILSHHQWPGNVREIQNVVQRLLFINEKLIDVAYVQNALGVQNFSANKTVVGDMEKWDFENILPLKQVEKSFRKEYFKFVSNHTESDAEASRKLGLAPPNYYRMCKELGLK